MSLTGADPEQLEVAAAELRAAADELDHQATGLTSTLWSVAWVGGVATRFLGEWNRGHRTRITSTASFVREAAERLDQNASEQRTASAAARSGGVVAVPPLPASPGSPGRPLPKPEPASPLPSPSPASEQLPPRNSEADRSRLDEFDDVLSELGIAEDAAGAASELAAALLREGAAGELFEFLADPAFVKSLDAAGVAFDVAGVVVDLLQDYADHPHLSFDERVFHALIDSATRTAISQGSDAAITWGFTAAGTAAAPVVGTWGGFIIGKGLGYIAGRVADHGVDELDAATDFVDWTADSALEVYRLAKAAGGARDDVIGLGLDVATGTRDLAGDVGAVIVDGGVQVATGVVNIGAVVDLGGGVIVDGLTDAGKSLVDNTFGGAWDIGR